MEKEALTLDALAIAMAAHNSGASSSFRLSVLLSADRSTLGK
jgi:hypothetical protein